MVEYGIARLRSEHIGQIVERLAFVSLLQWLETQERDNILSNIRKRLSLEDSRGLAYEELLVLYLLRTLRHPVPLSAIFNFHGTAPWWATAHAQIVGHLEGADVPVDVLGEAPQNPGLGAVHFAATPEDIIHWLENTDAAPPILLPTPLFGADVMARVRVFPPARPTMEVIVLGQGKSYTRGNLTSLDADTTTKALDSLNEDHWFKKMKVSDPDRRQKLVNAIKKHHILRFLGGYPLLPNLNSTAASVTQAISALGLNTPLATIDLHAFKAEFLTNNEFRDVLTPMEDALSRKRKASEMDG
jgi:hypothetical protein